MAHMLSRKCSNFYPFGLRSFWNLLRVYCVKSKFLGPFFFFSSVLSAPVPLRLPNDSSALIYQVFSPNYDYILKVYSFIKHLFIKGSFFAFSTILIQRYMGLSLDHCRDFPWWPLHSAFLPCSVLNLMVLCSLKGLLIIPLLLQNLSWFPVSLHAKLNPCLKFMITGNLSPFTES